MKAYIAVILTLITTQAVKLALHMRQYGSINFWVVLEDGGMPSVYASTLTSLTTAIGLQTGLSLLFLAMVVVTLTVLNEVMKVKRNTGMQPEHMARFIDIREIFRRKLTEGTNHTPKDVFTGVFIGIVVTALLYLV